MRVDDDVGDHSGGGEGKVEMGNEKGKRTLLSVTRGELVADLGISRDAEDEQGLSDIGAVVGEGDDVVDPAGFTLVEVSPSLDVVLDVFVADLAGDGIAALETTSCAADGSVVEKTGLGVIAGAASVESCRGGATCSEVGVDTLGGETVVFEFSAKFALVAQIVEDKNSIFLLGFGISSTRTTMRRFVFGNDLGDCDVSIQQTTFDGRTIDDDGVVHIVSGVRQDSDDGVDTKREVVKTHLVHCTSADEVLLRRHHSEQLRIFSPSLRLNLSSASLFGQTTLEQVTRRAVVFEEGNRVGSEGDQVASVSFDVFEGAANIADTIGDVGGNTSNVDPHLLPSSDFELFAGMNVANRAEKTTGTCEDVKSSWLFLFDLDDRASGIDSNGAVVFDGGSNKNNFNMSELVRVFAVGVVEKLQVAERSINATSAVSRDEADDAAFQPDGDR